jgi:hypothetical protein
MENVGSIPNNPRPLGRNVLDVRAHTSGPSWPLATL